ncbi:hypothetical protein AVEN_162238-1 [Araneus ventricosus]|uniref:Transmembrane protein 218 n=1 Tax=Araneus ventricosus TaxID=182803 RepID=A0A4Y2SFA3_ARAVE|nr:hypothetical protein AVEN_15651-1 [Araneus ventricosus]GBN86269.1 hypothetical protein AVEN_24736-1 [Araneus ventricosus]GBN86487.1 hypothetical protein AVEN_259186-1 [Araneus ventricosus]GBN86493.1 hypothetical protein AVEN_162238-1 [Araneus ventricosus]
MSSRIFGAGAGVFVLAIVWIITIALVAIFSKVKRPLSFVGIIFVAAASLATVILVFIPRGPETPDPLTDLLPPDYLFLWKCVLVVFLLLSFIVSIVLMVIENWAVSMPAKPLRKVARRTVVCDSS